LTTKSPSTFAGSRDTCAHPRLAPERGRIADYATNIAEDVIYMMEGWIVRHGAGLEGEGPREG
jgi:hypothetical protein